MFPYVHADGSAGFRTVGGGGNGFGDLAASATRFAHPFTRFPQVVPRLRLLGADPTAPIANLSALIQALPPVPVVGESLGVWESGMMEEAGRMRGQVGESEDVVMENAGEGSVLGAQRMFSDSQTHAGVGDGRAAAPAC